MNAIKVISIWGIVATSEAVAGGLIASSRNRDHSWWAAWCFVVPPMLILLLLLPRNVGPRPRQRTLDEDDREVI